MNDLTNGEILRRKPTFSPFIPRCRGLRNNCHPSCDVTCTFIFNYKSVHRKMVTVITYHKICNAFKCRIISLTFTLIMALPLLLITTYVLLSGWRYAPDFLTNQNHCCIPKLNACFILDNDASNSVNIMKVAIPLRGVIILTPPAKVRIR